MKKLFVVVVVFQFFIVHAQNSFEKKITLKWNDKKLVHIDAEREWFSPAVEGKAVNYKTMLPLFVEKWEIPNGKTLKSFEISNVVYKAINKNRLYDAHISAISSSLEEKAFVRGTRNKTHLFVKINPLIKKGNTYKKVESFTITYKLETKKHTTTTKSASNSVLNEGSWYKFGIDKTGVYKIDKTFLSNLGINTSGINPQNISIYGNGGQMLPFRIGDFRYDDLQENSIQVVGESDGVFDTDDYILFYAKGPHDWVHNNSLESLQHRKNSFSEKAYYFIHIGDTAGQRISAASVVSGTPVLEFTKFDDYIFHEIDIRNIAKMGRKWQGESFHIENVQHFNMNFDNVDTSTPIKVKTTCVANSTSPSNWNVKVNGSSLYSFSTASIGSHIAAKEGEGSGEILVSGSALDIEISFSASASAKGYLDYIEVIGKKNLKANSKQFGFRNFSMIEAGGLSKFTLQNPSNISQIWDVTDYTNPKTISNTASSGVFSFLTTNGVLKEYVVVHNSDYYTPTMIDNPVVENQNLHSLENVDYVIITKKEFVDEAEQIADYHRAHSGLNVKTIPLYQIYNEFGSGAPDITAIRDFVKHLYEHSEPKLQYVLLYGDSSFDYKNIEEAGENIVPTYEYYQDSFSEVYSIVTDDFFAIVSDDDEGVIENNESSNTMDVAISRIPVRTELEASEVTAKILNYYNSKSFGSWRNKVLMLADDVDKNWEKEFEVFQEALADQIKATKPIFNIKKLYADAYPQVITAGGASYPAFNAKLNESIEQGALILDYYGHGGEDGLGSERLLSNDEIRAWNNRNTLPLFVIISCEFARFDNPDRPNTGGELTIRNKNGGAVHQIATARAIYTSTAVPLNNTIMPHLLELDSDSKSIAEHLRISKNENYVHKQRFFVLSFGDPAMHLAIPKPEIILTHMNGTSIEESLDTISALSHVSFKGIVANAEGEILPDFNGTIETTVYDKSSDKETLANGTSDFTMIFDTQESKIFRGMATVSNGIFEFEFVAPEDIIIAYGKGKLSFYAENGVFDKGGYNLDISVGGINDEAPSDNTGPVIKLYMNDKSFIDGGTTNQSPLFLAFLEDENGINTSLTAVDHDIVATLDGDLSKSIILNDYYQTELDDYTKGNLEYRLRHLEVGEHSIHLKAYDTYNNKSEATLNFIVLDDNGLALDHVLNYPNPFVNYTEFWFNHNKPNEALEVQIQIYTVSGKLVKTINQLVQNSGGLSRDLKWDGLDDFGKKIGKGVYVYKLSVKSVLSGLKGEKFEKLVILQ